MGSILVKLGLLASRIGFCNVNTKKPDMASIGNCFTSDLYLCEHKYKEDPRCNQREFEMLRFLA